MKQKLEEEIDEEEIEVEVNMEGELITTLKELETKRKKHKKTSRKLVEVHEIIVNLKV